MIMALSKRFDKMWVGGYVQADNLSGAVFDDSPLLKRRNSYSAGIAVSWIFKHSDRMVMSNE